MENLKKRLNFDYSVLGTYEKVAEIYDVSKALIWKILNTDYEPKRDEIRERFGLPKLRTVMACIKCGEFHPQKSCTGGKHKKRNRLSINLDDPRSAGKSIMKHMDSGVVDDLIVILMEKMLMKG